MTIYGQEYPPAYDPGPEGNPPLDPFAVHRGHLADLEPDGPPVPAEQPEPKRSRKAGPSGSAGSAGPDGSAGPKRHAAHRGIKLADLPPQDGETLLDDVRAWLGRHITVINDTDLDVLTLWAAHTHAVRWLHTTPRLQIDSPVPESGKTTVLEHMERLCFRAVLASSIGSSALLTRIVAEEPRTLLLDEVDRTLDPKRDGVGELLAILNSGYKAGATRPTLVPVKGGGWEARELPTFAPVILAGNQPMLPNDTRSRIIRVLLFPDWDGRAEESEWELIDDDAAMLSARLARWVSDSREEFAPRPQMPPGCTSRFREKWQPLARIAQAASPRWMEVVMKCAAEDVATVAADRDAGLAHERPALLVLRHMVELWPEGEPFWVTEGVVHALVREHPETWGPESPYGKALTMQRLGSMLTANYGIRTVRRDTADKNSARGYRRAAFDMAFSALRSRPAASPATDTQNPDTPGGYLGQSTLSVDVDPSAKSAEPAQPAGPAESDGPLADLDLDVELGPPCPSCSYRSGHRPECETTTQKELYLS